MRELLETPESVSQDTGYHLDRCLGCLACTTTCPSGVDYHHLIEIGRDRLDKKVRRPLADRAMRRMLALVIPHAERFRLMIRLGNIGRVFSPLMPSGMRAALAKLPKKPAKFDRVGAKTSLILGSVELDHRLVETGLVHSVGADERVENLEIDGIDSLHHALAAIPFRLAVAKLHRFKRAGRGT